MKHTIEKLPKSAVKITVTVEVTQVKEAYEKVLESHVNETVIEGFRKGQAPKKMVEDKVGVSKLYADVIDKLLQTYYPQALKESHVDPVSNPKVEIKEFALDKDFEFMATVATRPEVKVGDYKKHLEQRIKDKTAAEEKRLAEEKKDEKPHVHLGSNDVLEALVEASDYEVPELLVDEETDRMVSKLVNQVQTVGMSMEQYLKAQNKSADDLRQDYLKIASNNLKAEFTMAHLIKEEKIEVTDKEVEEMIDAVGDEKAAEELRKDSFQKLYVKSIIQKNKLISKIIEEAEEKGGLKHDHE